MKRKLVCPRCQNRDQNFFYHGSKGWYCRKCISFGRALIEEELQPVTLQPVRAESEEYVLRYPLTPQQKSVGEAAADAVDHQDVLIHAVCGAGKTEMTVPVIAKCLRENRKICFAIPRRQVVLELQQRLSEYFPKANVIAVCGGHSQVVDGDLIICTTHQLYRYYHAFSVLILDEPDAFPFRGNPVLHGIAHTACCGHTMYLTATPDPYLRRRIAKEELYVLHLNQRPHGHPLPVPQIHAGPFVFLLIGLLVWLKGHTKKPCIVFLPTIRMANLFALLFGRIFLCDVVTSKTEEKDQKIEKFRNQQKGVLFATTVLERGVTIPHADVCVFYADHGVFDEAGLVQMAGRAGRAFDDPYGDVLFLCTQKSAVCLKAKQSIQEANEACIV